MPVDQTFRPSTCTMKDLQKCFLWNFFKGLNIERWMFEWKNYALVVNKILPFFQGGVNWGGGGGGEGERRIWKIKRRWNYGAGAVFLKRVVGEGGGILPIYFFQGLSFLHLEITIHFAKLSYTFEVKLFFSATIISWKNSILFHLYEPENIP